MSALRRRTKPSVEIPMPSSAKDDGSGTEAGVSENWFLMSVTRAKGFGFVIVSVTVRLVAAAKVMLSIS